MPQQQQGQHVLHHSHQQQHHSHRTWLRKIASPRFLFLLVCCLTVGLFLRDRKTINLILSADSLVVWTEPYLSEDGMVSATAEPSTNVSTTNSLHKLQNPYSALVRRPKRTNGTLYRCGFSTGRLIRLLFDDYLPDDEVSALDDKSIPRFTRDNVTNPADILFFGSVTGPCDGITKEWLNENFTGKVLFHNGESHGDGRGPNSYMISSLETSERNVRVPFVSAVFVGQVPSMLPVLIWKDSPRPRNTGEFFMVYATSNCVYYREATAVALSSVGIVHYARCRPSESDNFTRLADDDMEWSVNYRRFSKFRFCLVMENSNHDGYITEKILNAFLGGCVPIWYGTTDVWKIFDRNSFLYADVTQPGAMEALVDQVRYLESNRTAYDEIFTHPILVNGNVTLEEYFSLDDSIGHGKLKHEIRVMMGLEDENYHQLG